MVFTQKKNLDFRKHTFYKGKKRERSNLKMRMSLKAFSIR